MFNRQLNFETRIFIFFIRFPTFFSEQLYTISLICIKYMYPQKGFNKEFTQTTKKIVFLSHLRIFLFLVWHSMHLQQHDVIKAKWHYSKSSRFIIA